VTENLSSKTPVKPVQIRALFQSGVARLRQAGIQDPELEASLLLAESLGLHRTALHLRSGNNIEEGGHRRFEDHLSRRLAREPLAYILGRKEFWSREFVVSEDVLIPRPETEFLLEKALAVLKTLDPGDAKPLKILDLGTGSGVIAVVLALELPEARITAVDSSYSALQVARHNATKHEVADQIRFVQSSWFGGLAARAGFDAVLANPPYVPQEVMALEPGTAVGALQPEVRDFEPVQALDGGMGGIVEIRRIAAGLAQVLRPQGWFFMEIGADQEEEVRRIYGGAESYDSVTVFADYAGRPRVLQARRL
jgi:release factor glutamine methyltransferase